MGKLYCRFLASTIIRRVESRTSIRTKSYPPDWNI